LQAAFHNAPAIHIGETNDGVRLVQEGLVADGIPMPGSTKPAGEMDGGFGSETLAALQQFQARHALAVDGIVGHETLGELDRQELARSGSASGGPDDLSVCPAGTEVDDSNANQSGDASAFNGKNPAFSGLEPISFGVKAKQGPKCKPSGIASGSDCELQPPAFVTGGDQDTVFFDENSDVLNTDYQAHLDTKIQGDWKGATAIELHGFASQEGDVHHNFDLACRRAATVKKAFLSAKLPPPAVISGALKRISHGATAQFGPRRLNRNVTIKATLPPRTTPSTPEAKLPPVTVVVRKVGSAVGSVPCSLSTVGTVVPLPADFALKGFALIVDSGATSNPTNDAKDQPYRLFSRRTFDVTCSGGSITATTSAIDTDVGLEPVPGTAVKLTPPPMVIESESTTSAGGVLNFNWVAKGRLNAPLGEAGFQAVCPRTSKDIWNKVDGQISCTGVSATATTTLTGSHFPTHRVFVDGIQQGLDVKQGVLSDLWVPDPGDPEKVK